jgi:hypothetical protein
MKDKKLILFNICLPTAKINGQKARNVNYILYTFAH